MSYDLAVVCNDELNLTDTNVVRVVKCLVSCSTPDVGCNNKCESEPEYPKIIVGLDSDLPVIRRSRPEARGVLRGENCRPPEKITDDLVAC